MINFDYLRYLISLARSESMTSTASALYVTPSTISKAMKNLEKSLDIDLYKRTSDGISMTENGLKLAALAENIIFAVNEFQLEAQRMAKQKDAWQLEICAEEGIANNILPSIIPGFHKYNIDVELKICKFADIKESVLSKPNSLGMAIISAEECEHLKTSGEYQVTIINSFKVCLVMNKASQWAKRFGVDVGIKELLEIPIALTDSFKTPKKLIDQLLLLGKKNFLYFPSVNVIVELVNNCIAATLGIPTNDANLRCFPIRESDTLYFCYFTTSVDEILLESLTEITRKYLYKFYPA